MNQQGAPRVEIVEHPPVYCPHCGNQQTKSLLLARGAAPPTICLACKMPVRITGPLWMEKLSDLAPDAAVLPTLRVVLAQLEAQGARQAGIQTNGRA